MTGDQLDALADALAERVAARVLDRLAEVAEREPREALIDAAEVASRFRVSRDYVYAHATELGAVRLGDGDRPRLRFDPEIVLDRLAARPSPTATPRRAKPRRRASSGDLLPVRGPQ